MKNLIRMLFLFAFTLLLSGVGTNVIGIEKESASVTIMVQDLNMLEVENAMVYDLFNAQLIVGPTVSVENITEAATINTVHYKYQTALRISLYKYGFYEISDEAVSNISQTDNYRYSYLIKAQKDKLYKDKRLC